jgi:hypothetical protein
MNWNHGTKASVPNRDKIGKILHDSVEVATIIRLILRSNISSDCWGAENFEERFRNCR